MPSPSASRVSPAFCASAWLGIVGARCGLRVGGGKRQRRYRREKRQGDLPCLPRSGHEQPESRRPSAGTPSQAIRARRHRAALPRRSLLRRSPRCVRTAGRPRGLITRRSRVRIPPPLSPKRPATAGLLAWMGVLNTSGMVPIGFQLGGGMGVAAPSTAVVRLWLSCRRLPADALAAFHDEEHLSGSPGSATTPLRPKAKAN